VLAACWFGEARSFWLGARETGSFTPVCGTSSVDTAKEAKHLPMPSFANLRKRLASRRTCSRRSPSWRSRSLPKHGDARYHVFVVTSWGGGEPRLLGAEHSELRWVNLAHALALPLAHPGYGNLFRAVLGRGGAFERDI